MVKISFKGILENRKMILRKMVAHSRVSELLSAGCSGRIGYALRENLGTARRVVSMDASCSQPPLPPT